MNVQANKDDITRAFIKFLPELAEVLLAMEDAITLPDTVVADLLQHNIY